jgi:UPF0176 protein
MTYTNISAYQFIALAEETLPDLQNSLTQMATTHALKGTILLSTEGVNMFLAGEPDRMQAFQQALHAIPAFSSLTYKESLSSYVPFKRLLVRIKKEIITMQHPEIQPEKETAPYLEPATLKAWYAAGKEMLVLDTRNHYEYTVGSFDNAAQVGIENFSDFPAAIAKLPESAKNMPVVTFCTGGIRCEKAAAYLLTQGFTEVWQLKGGILNYFEQCGGEYFQGNCFVFDARRAVDAALKEV